MEHGRRVDGKALRRLRRDAWLTQQELSKEAGVHEVTLHKIESGKVETPRKSTIEAIAKVLKVNPEVLLRPLEQEDGDRPIDKVLRERQRQRELAAISPGGSPYVGRYGSPWDFLGDAEVDRDGLGVVVGKAG